MSVTTASQRFKINRAGDIQSVLRMIKTIAALSRGKKMRNNSCYTETMITTINAGRAGINKEIV